MGNTSFNEIESMPICVQVHLLRTLQERTIERLGSNKFINLDLRAVAVEKVDLRLLTKESKFYEGSLLPT